MEVTHLSQTMSLCSTALPHHRRIVPRLKRRSTVAVLTQPADSIGIRPPAIPTGVTEKASPSSDSWFDRIAIHHLSQSVQAATGLRNTKSGYDSLVEAATAASRNFDKTKQRELVIQALDRAFPRPILSLIRTLLPQSKFAREYFAVFTTLFFAWLVGPCEDSSYEWQGPGIGAQWKKRKNVVHIKKCRFLEQTNCAGMCSNLCKIPSQTFIKDSFGVPLNMVPNFEDMSCEMIFGQDPPALSDDPAFKQPCYKLCKARRHVNCSS